MENIVGIYQHVLHLSMVKPVVLRRIVERLLIYAEEGSLKIEGIGKYACVVPA